jgi:hypothetical protein
MVCLDLVYLDRSKVFCMECDLTMSSSLIVGAMLPAVKTTWSKDCPSSFSFVLSNIAFSSVSSVSGFERSTRTPNTLFLAEG